MTVVDHYCVIGNPIEHSRSPEIHTEFARMHHQSMKYTRLLSPRDGFARTVKEFVANGGRGMNVTVPFKEQACTLADYCSERAQIAGAANTLIVRPDGIHGDNTDGVGLVRDLTERHHITLAGADIVLIGAGGAARGVILPLLQAGVAAILITNRTVARASALVEVMQDQADAHGVCISACELSALATLARPDGAVWINATASSLDGAASPVAAGLLANAALAYDMMYASQPTPFMVAARADGARQVADGLGMLVEQAAESFFLWRGMRPATDGVYQQLR